MRARKKIKKGRRSKIWSEMQFEGFSQRRRHLNSDLNTMEITIKTFWNMSTPGRAKDCVKPNFRN
jgi:hypothetical protein